MTKCYIHYAKGNHKPLAIWREQPGLLLFMGRGPGPRNCLVQTEHGTVVVPRGNVRFVMEDSHEDKN